MNISLRIQLRIIFHERRLQHNEFEQLQNWTKSRWVWIKIFMKNSYFSQATWVKWFQLCEKYLRKFSPSNPNLNSNIGRSPIYRLPVPFEITWWYLQPSLIILLYFLTSLFTSPLSPGERFLEIAGDLSENISDIRRTEGTTSNWFSMWRN